MKRLFVDMDGVLVDFDSGIARIQTAIRQDLVGAICLVNPAHLSRKRR